MPGVSSGKGKGSVLGRRFKWKGKGSVLGKCFKQEGKGSVLGRRFNWEGKSILRGLITTIVQTARDSMKRPLRF